jgi:DnaA family protein
VSTPQLPLSLRSPPDQRLASFIGDTAVRDAVAAAADGRAASWLYLTGPAGSGKTHLLLAACAEAAERGRPAAYVPLTALAGRLAQALPAQESTALVCLDGLEALAGQPDDQEALFHFHNRSQAAGALLVYAARDNPAALGLALPDLVTRLGQCTRFSLAPPDESVRRLVLQQRAARRGLELDEAVLDFLMRRVGRDLAGLTALLDRLDKASLAAQRRITIPFLRQQL